jgi:hypothetical protein
MFVGQHAYLSSSLVDHSLLNRRWRAVSITFAPPACIWKNFTPAASLSVREAVRSARRPSRTFGGQDMEHTPCRRSFQQRYDTNCANEAGYT